MPQTSEQLLNGAELARALGVSKTAISQWIDSGFPYWPDAKGRKLYYLSEALAWRERVKRGEIKRWYPKRGTP